MIVGVVSADQLGNDWRASTHLWRTTPYDLAVALILALDQERELTAVGRSNMQDLNNVKEAMKRWDHRSLSLSRPVSRTKKGWPNYY